MNKNQSSKLNSLLAVQTLLAANQERVTTLPALDEAAEELTDIIMGISTNVQVQSSPSGATDAKHAALVELGDAAFEVAGGVLSFAEKSGNRTLAGRVRFAHSAITGGKGNLVVARGQGIVDAAAENLPSLGDHGVTQAKLTALKQKLKTYDTLRLMPRQAKAAAAAATRQLERLFPDADRLLANRVDKLIWQFRASAPEFYEKYQVARAIVDAPTTSSGEKPSVVPNAKAA
jgi:hypothetical protein